MSQDLLDGSSEPSVRSDGELRSAVRSESVDGRDTVSIRTALSELVSHYSPVGSSDADVLVVPDTHYPYHPSTGLVTNPTVVHELVDLLDGEVAIGISGSASVDVARVGRYLGYERVADNQGIELVDLDDSANAERKIRLVGRTVNIEVPEPLLDSEVVAVPTARQSTEYGFAGGMITLARATVGAPSRDAVLATIRTCWPALTIVDATLTYADGPQRTGQILASEDIVAASRAAAELLDFSPEDAPHLVPDTVGQSAVESLLQRTPDGSSSDDSVMESGYRLYADLTGDLVPPQMLSGEGDE